MDKYTCMIAVEKEFEFTCTKELNYDNYNKTVQLPLTLWNQVTHQFSSDIILETLSRLFNVDIINKRGKLIAYLVTFFSYKM